MSNKITPMDELNIICGRAMGQTYEQLTESTGHGTTAIARTLKPDNLCQHVTALYCQNHGLIGEVAFYKKYLHWALAVWSLSLVAGYVLLFIS